MNLPKKQSNITVFCSYATSDREWREQLAIHLSQLKRDGFIEEWDDQQIPAGLDRVQEIDQAIRRSCIILLLVSANFLASDTCYRVEMQHALERHRRGEARVIPIIVRPCDWQDSPFAHLQCLPRNTKPITTWDNQDEAFASIVQELRKIITQQPLPIPPLSKMQRHNRSRLLKRVRATWIEGLLDQSLHRAAWTDLHLQEQSDALENPWRLLVQELEQESHPLPSGTNIVQVYDEADGELLILGEPGSGKTTLLLQLARTLLDRALADEHLPMPIIFNLSSWAQKQEPLPIWLVEELKTRYYIPHQVGKDWVERNQILPLLDGLDEVASSARGACLQAISAYHGQNSQGETSPVVCCRSQEYQALSLHLPVQRAVSILPLTDEQIEEYLSRTQEQLEGLRQALHNDTELQELARRPLMLNIFTLAYRGMTSEALSAESANEQRLCAAFGTYVERMLIRREKLQRWKEEHLLHWLTYIAKQLYRQQQTVFSVEELQPSWLQEPQQHLYRWSLVLIFGLVVGLISGLICGLELWLIGGPALGIIVGLGEALLVGSFSARSFGRDAGRIRPAEVLSWSWKDARDKGLFMGLSSGLFSGILVSVIFGPIPGLLSIPFIGLSGVMQGGLSGNQLTERTRLSPNEGIQRSKRNGLLMGLFFGLYSGPFFGLGVWSVFKYVNGLSFGLLAALFGWLTMGLIYGLGAFVQHFILRFWLWRTNCLPWDLLPFLDEATERLLLHRVGNGHIFVHRLLLEYLAALDESTPSEITSSEDKTEKWEQKH